MSNVDCSKASKEVKEVALLKLGFFMLGGLW